MELWQILLLCNKGMESIESISEAVVLNNTNHHLLFLLQGVSVPCIPRNNKQKRVDLFYSSWCIRPGKNSLCNHPRNETT